MIPSGYACELRKFYFDSLNYSYNINISEI